eukprot:Pgem_evm1s16310
MEYIEFLKTILLTLCVGFTTWLVICYGKKEKKLFEQVGTKSHRQSSLKKAGYKNENGQLFIDNKNSKRTSDGGTISRPVSSSSVQINIVTPSFRELPSRKETKSKRRRSSDLNFSESPINNGSEGKELIHDYILDKNN